MKRNNALPLSSSNSGRTSEFEKVEEGYFEEVMTPSRRRSNRTRQVCSSPSKNSNNNNNNSCVGSSSIAGLHYRKSPPSKLLRSRAKGSDDNIASSLLQNTTNQFDSNKKLQQRDLIDRKNRITSSRLRWMGLNGYKHGKLKRNDVDRIPDVAATVSGGGDKGRDGRKSKFQNYSHNPRFDNDIFQILKLGVLVFGIIGIFTIWKMGTVTAGGYYFADDHYENGITITDFESARTSQRNPPSDFASLLEKEHHFEPKLNHMYHHHQNQLHDIRKVIQTESKSILRGPRPKLSQAASRYLSWKDEERKSFSTKSKLTHQQRRDRIKSQTQKNVNNKDNHDSQNYDFYNFDFLQNHNFFHKNKNYYYKNDTKKHYDKHSLPCSIAAQTAAKRYPHLYPDVHTINENSVVLISGILSRIGFHLALKLATECNVKNIIGIDPMLPNTKQNRMKILDQLHALYKVVPKLQKNLILPYAGFNPKDVYNHHHAKYMKEENGEIDFSSFEPTHVVHLASTDAYRSSSLDGSDSVYLESTANETHTNERFGNHIFGLRQSLAGIDHLLSSLISDRSTQDSPIHFTFVSGLQSSTMENGTKAKASFFEKSSTFRLKTKQMEETILEMYKKESIENDAFVTLRFPYVYGPWGREGDIDYDIAEIAVKHWNDDLSLPSKDSILQKQSKKNSWEGWEEEMLFVDGKTNLFVMFCILHELSLPKCLPLQML